jgi:hypothetical protein
MFFGDEEYDEVNRLRLRLRLRPRRRIRKKD